ncbi:MAG: hypothetical protein K0R50_501 [Eubacterium sp.]|jgi:hypothetical protein|nr:hypothetical protein [Eubacterium sp.]
MFLPMVLNNSNPMLEEKYIQELLSINEFTEGNGFTLSTEDAESIIEFRKTTLNSHGRVDYSLQATKEIVRCFSSSTFIDPENFIFIVNELQELFYYLKNETEDKMPDDKLIRLMYEYFENICGGSMDFLSNRLQEFSDNLRRQENNGESCLKAGDAV